LRRHLGVEASDLSRVPVLSHGYVSVSHTTDLGGYAVGPYPLGFDVELVSRVSVRAVARVSRFAEELARSPSAGHLWCAKEAAFKALYHFRQPNVLSALEIEWSGAEKFHLANGADFGVRRGSGQIFVRGPHLLAVYEVRR
jgi:4'-phosphopantetheinyl transferase EntD